MIASTIFGARKARGRSRLISETSVPLALATSVRVVPGVCVSCRRYRCARAIRSMSAASGRRAGRELSVRIILVSTPRRRSDIGQVMIAVVSSTFTSGRIAAPVTRDASAVRSSRIVTDPADRSMRLTRRCTVARF